MGGGKALEQFPGLRVKDTTAINDKGGEAKIVSSTNLQVFGEFLFSPNVYDFTGAMGHVGLADRGRDGDINRG